MSDGEVETTPSDDLMVGKAPILVEVPPEEKPSKGAKKAVKKQTLQATRTADAILAAAGAAGSLALLQLLQEYVETPIIGGFLIGSSIKFFLNRNPPSLEAFWKCTAAAIVIGSSLHLFLWMSGPDDDGSTMKIPAQYSQYLVLFFIILFWKLEAGSIWGSGIALATHVAFQSGHWGKNVSSIGAFQALTEDFPGSYILRPYLVGHFFLYGCALGLATLRRHVRIYLLKNEFFSSQAQKSMRRESILKDLPSDATEKDKLRVLFDRMDTSGDGRLDAPELKLALRASVGVDLSIEDCAFMIGSVDTDGDGMIDFNEFCESVDQILLR
jgi:hypothetical protein